jgi:hypothetical protein
MAQSQDPPIKTTTRNSWVQLIMLCLVMVQYIIQVISFLSTEGPLGRGIGLDFRAFWSAGYIANTEGIAQVYDLARMEEVQRTIIPVDQLASFQVAPVSVLPVFIPLFQLFALLPPIPAFFLWSALNLVGCILYLVFFLRRVKAPNWQMLVLLGLLTYPSFSNLYWGQINLLLMICIGEFIRQVFSKHDIRAGLWIGGLVLKPQLLILIVPALLMQRKWKMLGGFSLTILVAMGGSFLLGKLTGLMGVAGIMTQFTKGIPTNSPEFMMNWRMIGEQLIPFLPSAISWGVVVLGMIGTALLAFLLWRRPMEFHSTNFLVCLTGTLAATLVVTWHSHVHMAMVLLPPVLFLTSRRLFPIQINSWLFSVPIVLLFVIYPLKILDLTTFNILALIPGLFLFIINLVFLLWAWKTLRALVSLERHA